MAKKNPITAVLNFFARRKAARLRKLAFQKREREFTEECADYYEKIRSAAFPNSITKAIDDPWVAYFLAHNPERVDAIAQLDSTEVTKEIAKIKADIETERAKTSKKISTAPPPPPSIKGSGDPGIRSKRPERAKISEALDVKPIWILKQIPGGQWECGDESAPVIMENLLGLADMAHAIGLAGREINPFDLPGSGDALAELKACLSKDRNSSIKETQGLRFGADDMADPRAMQQYKAKEKDLLDEIEAALDTGNESEQAGKEAELTDLRMRMAEMTSPGGKPKKLDAGDPTIKATKAARERKNRATGKLREAGLSDMAGHLDKFYKVRQKIIIYTPAIPFPKWILKKQ